MLPEAVGRRSFPSRWGAGARDAAQRRPQPLHHGRVTGSDTNRRPCIAARSQATCPCATTTWCWPSARGRARLIPDGRAHAAAQDGGRCAAHPHVVLRRLARIELRNRHGLRRTLGHFVVMGRWLLGRRSGREMVDCLAASALLPARGGRRIAYHRLQGDGRLLPEVVAQTRRSGAPLAVRERCRCGASTRVRAVNASGGRCAMAASSNRRRAHLHHRHQPTPWPSCSGRGAGAHRRRAELRVKGHERLWAIGDCASVPNAFDGRISPPTAQFAVRQAGHLARNLKAAIAGEGWRRFATDRAG